MHVSQRFLGAVLASFVQVMAVGCDAERDDDDMEAVDDGDDEPDDETDEDEGDGDDGDTSDDKGDRIKTGDPSSPSKDPGYSPCGNGVVDEGEECDDGWFNDASRECTDACLANDCNLDEQGFCTDAIWPALDFDLYPCAAHVPASQCEPDVATG